MAVGSGKTKPCWARIAEPLAAYGDGLRVELERLGYTPLTAAGQVRLVAHLSRWMLARNLTVEALTSATVDTYFAERRSAGYTNETTARALRPLLNYLRGLGVLVPQVAQAATPVEVALARYRNYLRIERGLADSTVELNVRLVRPFLEDRAKSREGRLDLEAMTAAEVNTFVVETARRWPRSVKRIVSALRSLLRFLYIQGILEVGLAASIPSPAGWRLTGIPRAVPADQVAALLASCEQQATATGLRDLAILTLMARLGLRAGEVAGLRLEEIDWRRGELTVRGKGNRCDRLPIPADVGTVIVDYLRSGRPAGALERTVFVRAQAPYRALAPAGVIAVVGAAGRRSGTGVTGAHRLRHSAATAMLTAGSSLEEIGQVLRHIRPSTTAIYAKVDLQALRPLARTWPLRGSAA